MYANRSFSTAWVSVAVSIVAVVGSAVAGPPKGSNGRSVGGNHTQSIGGNHSHNVNSAKFTPGNGGIVAKHTDIGNNHHPKSPSLPLGSANGGVVKSKSGSNGNTTYVGSANGGVWKHTNGGQHTHHQNFTPKNGNTGVVPPWLQKPHHNHHHTVYAKAHCNPVYHQHHGVHKSFGYCYTGFNHSHWYCRKWSAVNNCWFFFDQGCNAWYYWCQPDGCYYPCSYRPYESYVYVAPAPMVVTTGSPAQPQPPQQEPAPMQLPPLPGEE